MHKYVEFPTTLNKIVGIKIETKREAKFIEEKQEADQLLYSCMNIEHEFKILGVWMVDAVII